MNDAKPVERLEHAVDAFLRQEFGSSAAAIVGFVDILLEDARRHDIEGVVPDLERMRAAGAQLSTVIRQVVSRSEPVETDHGRLRHEIRTPLNAIKGYGELLVEEGREIGSDALLQDLGLVLGLADRMLSEIDGIIDFSGVGGDSVTKPIEIVSNILREIRPLGSGDSSNLDAGSAWILVVDDNESNRDLLSRRLLREGYRVTTVEDGAPALVAVAAEAFDLVLLDLIMPGMSGFEVLCRLKANDHSRHLPVIVISALDELDSTVRCIEAGAEDYLLKPFNPILLRARINACLEKKRLRDREQVILAELRAETERSEALLLNILPRTIVERMRRGETVIADHIAEATILFSDIVDFSSLAARLSAEDTVALLGKIFSRFDGLAARYGLEKIKTIGDGYMVAGGLPEKRADHAIALAEMALAMIDAVDMDGRVAGEKIQLRIGLHTGALVAGVIGTHKFVYDVWGDTVNTAKRMETYGLPGRVHVSAATRRALGKAFNFEARGMLEIKGAGSMETYFLSRDQ